MTLQTSRAAVVACSLALVAAPGVAQNAYPCFAFNDTGASPTSPFEIPAPVSGALDVFFVAPVTATIDRVSAWVEASSGWIGLTVSLHPVTSSGVGPAVGASWMFAAGGDWRTSTAFTPAAVTAGSLWAVRFGDPTGPPSTHWVNVRADAAGLDALPYSLLCGAGLPTTASCSTWPAVGTAPIIMRLLSPTCAPGPSASTTLLGALCPPVPYSSFTAAAPILGTTPLVVHGMALGTAGVASLYWSIGFDPVGTTLPGGCTTHLDLASFAALDAIGVQPLALGLPVFGSFPVAIPNDPALAGLTLAVQSLFVGPNAVQASPTAVLTLGY